MKKQTYQCKWCTLQGGFHAGHEWEIERARTYGVELCPNHFHIARGYAYLPVVTERIRYGQERAMPFSTMYQNLPCHDCGARLGELHQPGCDAEECPTCRLQLLSCRHGDKWWPDEAVAPAFRSEPPRAGEGGGG